MMEIPASPKEIEEVQRLFVDEAGDPSMFTKRGFPIVDTPGCSRFFMLGKLEVEDSERLAVAMTDLRNGLIADPYFAGVESFRPERKKTALKFHAKDDLPEVRYLVFRLLREFGSALRFHAVVCDKASIIKVEKEKRERDAAYRYAPNALYDSLVRSLFNKLHRFADRYDLCVAKRGNKDRNQAITLALAHAERDFESNYGFSRGGIERWTVNISNPETSVCLQAVDYYLWAIQRFYETRYDPSTGARIIDKDSGQALREDRFVNMLWPQIGEIHDLHFGPEYGTFYTALKPISLEERFGDGTKKKRSRV